MQNPYSILAGMMGGTLSAATIYLSILMIFLWLICVTIGIGLFVLWIITLVDCIKRDEKNFTGMGSYEKIMWLLLIIFVSNIVPIIYYILVMRKKNENIAPKIEDSNNKQI